MLYMHTYIHTHTLTQTCVFVYDMWFDMNFLCAWLYIFVCMYPESYPVLCSWDSKDMLLTVVRVSQGDPRSVVSLCANQLPLRTVHWVGVGNTADDRDRLSCGGGGRYPVPLKNAQHKRVRLLVVCLSLRVYT